MSGLSKSKYTSFRKCPKCLWLGAYKSEEQQIDASTQSRFETGTAVGELAKGLFGPYTDVTTQTDDGHLDIKAMLARTQQCLHDGIDNICEAAFSYQGCYCAVDVLRKTDDGYAIYEVKSSTSADKEVYAQDVAFQKWVLTQCGVKVTGTYLVCINNQYVRNGALDIHQLFSINDISEAEAVEYPQVAANCKAAKAVLDNPAEPAVPIGPHCHEPYGCGFMSYCMRQCGIPDNEPTVFDLYRGSFEKQLEHVHNGIVSFPDIVKSGINLTPMQKMQVDCTMHGTKHIDKAALHEFLNSGAAGMDDIRALLRADKNGNVGVYRRDALHRAGGHGYGGKAEIALDVLRDVELREEQAHVRRQFPPVGCVNAVGVPVAVLLAAEGSLRDAVRHVFEEDDDAFCPREHVFRPAADTFVLKRLCGRYADGVHAAFAEDILADRFREGHFASPPLSSSPSSLSIY